MWKGCCLILPLCPWGHAVVWGIKQEPTNWYKAASSVSSQLVVLPHSGENVEGPGRSLEASQRVSQPTGLPAATFTRMLPASVFPATHPASQKFCPFQRAGLVGEGGQCPGLTSWLLFQEAPLGWGTWWGRVSWLGPYWEKCTLRPSLREVYPRRSVTLSLVCLFLIIFPPLTLKGKIHSDDRKIW